MSRSVDFNKEDIINKAMELFWSKGFEATTLNDLVTQTGLKKGSLYNTFKSKENLFILCLEKYGDKSRALFYQGGDAKAYLKHFFTRLVNEGAQKENTKGCFIMNSCIELVNHDNAAAKTTKTLFSATEKNLEKVIKNLEHISKIERQNLRTNLISAAFSIREISKFRKDKLFLTQIANNALRDIHIKI